MMFSCFTTKKVFASSERTDAFGRINTWRKSPRIIATRCAKYSGVTIPKAKSLGKKKNSWRQSFQISFLTCPNLGGEIHPKGVGL
jgi:hypothetical protein